MNKANVNAYIERAVTALTDSKIAKDGKIEKGYRGQISTFGAAVTNGSLEAAIAFFSNDKSESEFDRPALMKSICYVLGVAGDNKKANQYCNRDLYDYVRSNQYGTKASKKDKILDAAIALKLAMNLFELED